MAKAKKVKLVNSKLGSRTFPKDEAERILAWCERTGNVGLWKLDERDKKENE